MTDEQKNIVAAMTEEQQQVFYILYAEGICSADKAIRIALSTSS